MRWLFRSPRARSLRTRRSTASGGAGSRLGGSARSAAVAVRLVLLGRAARLEIDVVLESGGFRRAQVLPEALGFPDSLAFQILLAPEFLAPHGILAGPILGDTNAV